MSKPPDRPATLIVVVAEGFNLLATIAFLDPFRAANYLSGRTLYRWRLMSAAGGPVLSSAGAALDTEPLGKGPWRADMAVVSTSWTPEASAGPPLDRHLRVWARQGVMLIGLDTGGFVLAETGLLSGLRATVHYEHIDSFVERYPAVEVSEALFVIDGMRATCCGGQAATDLALTLLRGAHGAALGNAAARYIFHDRLRGEDRRQNPSDAEPLGGTAPPALRAAIRTMEANLEEPIPVPQISAGSGLSQRQLERLFARFTGKSPALYYRDIRLDRARGLVTQTELPMAEIAVACGFSGPEPFSRAYRRRFGLPPMRDRVEGRVPFEFRAWPMHSAGR